MSAFVGDEDVLTSARVALLGGW